MNGLNLPFSPPGMALITGGALVFGALMSCGPSQVTEQKPYKPSLAFGREAGFQLGVQARAGLPLAYQPKLDWLAQTLKNRQIQPKPIGLFASQREYAFRHRGAAGCPHCPVQAGLMFSSAKPFQHRFRIAAGESPCSPSPDRFWRSQCLGLRSAEAL